MEMKRKLYSMYRAEREAGRVVVSAAVVVCGTGSNSRVSWEVS